MTNGITTPDDLVRALNALAAVRRQDGYGPIPVNLDAETLKAIHAAINVCQNARSRDEMGTPRPFSLPIRLAYDIVMALAGQRPEPVHKPAAPLHEGLEVPRDLDEDEVTHVQHRSRRRHLR
jgi:hypothetical protein